LSYTASCPGFNDLLDILCFCVSIVTISARLNGP